MFNNRQNGDADMRIVAANNLPLIIGSMRLEIVDEVAESNKLATEAVVKVEELAGQGLDTQEKIDAVVEAVNNAKTLIVELEDDEKKVELLDRLNVVSDKVKQAQEALNVKQAKAAVEHAEQLPSEESVEQAEQAIEKLTDGEEKNTSMERIEVVKTILQEEQVLFTVLNTKLESTEEVDNAIAMLENARKLVEKVPNDQRALLTEKLQKAENKIVNGIISILDQKYNGKPEPIKETWLNLLIKNTIDQLDGPAKSHVNQIHKSIMRIVKEHATGKEVREAVEDWIQGNGSLV